MYECRCLFNLRMIAKYNTEIAEVPLLVDEPRNENLPGDVAAGWLILSSMTKTERVTPSEVYLKLVKKVPFQ